MNGKKNGKWEFYGEPKKIRDDNYKHFYPKLDSIVYFKHGINAKTYLFDYYDHLKRRIERNDSTIIQTAFHDNNIRWDKNFRDDTLHSYVATQYLNKNLLIETYFQKDGRPTKEMFSNDHVKQEVSKDYTLGYNITRDSYGTNYTELLSNKNGKPSMVREFVNNRLYNVKLYNEHGEQSDIGDFQNGNGVLYKKNWMKVDGLYFYGNTVESAELYVNGILTEIHRGFNEPALRWKKGDPGVDTIKFRYHSNGKTFLIEKYRNGLLFEVSYYDAEYNALDTGSFYEGNGWLKRYKLGSVSPYLEEYYENGKLKQKRRMKND